MSYKFESDVIKALEELYKTEANYDVIIHIGEVPNFKEFHAHSNFLCCRSHYFKSILSAKDITKKDGKYVIKNPNITPQAFDVIINYLYTGHVNITNKTEIEILNIMIASDDLKLNQLVKVAKDFFIKDQQQFLRNDPIEILRMVYCLEFLNDIQELCLEIICFEPEILFNSAKFIKLPASLLEVILKRDDLNLVEIEVWKYLIKWGLAQEKALNEDVSKWNQEKFNIFERILHKFIPLIRFYDISSEDYYNEVRPYEEILSKELRGEILKFHMVPGYKATLNKLLPRCPKFVVDSVLINQKHIKLFVNWINKRENNNFRYIEGKPYQLNLILRGSRDGFDPKSFHRKCDNKGASIVVIKIKNSNQIVGGYNPLDWSGCAQNNTTDSFIFSFIDYKNINSGKISRNADPSSAVISDSRYGPVFGKESSYNGNEVHDLCMHFDGRWNSKPNSYSDIISIPGIYFDIDDYEVFQVKEK